MKKCLALLVLLVSLSAFAAEPRILIACYSWGGNTRFAAEQIQKAVGGTIFAITPVKAYPKNYRKCVALAKREVAKNHKPALKSLPDFSAYDVVFIGSPNWCGTIAPPVATFASHPGLKEKKVFLFVTHGRGGMQNCAVNLGKLVQVAAAANFPGATVRKDVDKIQAWAKQVVK